MPITIKTQHPQPSPHAEAAVMLNQGHTITKDSKEESGEIIDHYTEVGATNPASGMDRIGVEMGFKMPVAPYTMVEFKVWREVACHSDDADAAYDAAKAWVEARINALVSEQQDALPE